MNAGLKKGLSVRYKWNTFLFSVIYVCHVGML